MLTDARIRSAMKSVQGEVTLTDVGAGNGAGSLKLVIRRLSTGGVSARWFAQTKRPIRQKRALGTYPALTLTDARQRMQTDIVPAIRAGAPLKAVATQGEAPTVERMFAAYAAAMRHDKRASASEVARVLLLAEHNAAKAIGRDRHPASVTADDVVAYVSRFYREGHRGAAAKALAYVSAAYGWAIKSTHDYTSADRVNWGVTINPASAVKKDARAVRQRDRALTADELRALWNAAIKADGGFGWIGTGAAVLLLVCCGQRVQETLRVDGAEIDIAAGLWTMPAHKTKGGKRPHVVPLNRFALDLFALLKSIHGDGPLFPARMGGESERIDHRSVNRAVKRFCEVSGVALFQSRDLRRTWKSRAHDAGVDRFTRDLIQQHAKHDTGSKSYDRADYLPQMREAMDKWGAWLASNVVERDNVAAASGSEPR